MAIRHTDFGRGNRRAIFIFAFAFSLLIFASLLYLFLLVLDNERLHYAAREGDLSAIQKCLDSHPERIESRSRLGMTPLHSAVWHGRIEAVRLLIARGANINAKWDTVSSDDGMWTNLHICTAYDYHNIAVILLHAGAMPNAVSTRGETPLDMAKRNRFQNLVELLSNQ